MTYLDNTTSRSSTTISRSSSPSSSSSPHPHLHDGQTQTHYRPPFIHATTAVAPTYLISPLHQTTSHPQSSLQSGSGSGSSTPLDRSSRRSSLHADSLPGVTGVSGISGGPGVPGKTELGIESSGIGSRSSSPHSGRGIYQSRRIPSALHETIGSRNGGGGVSKTWREKILPKDGGFGRVLIAGWVITTLGFVVVIALYRGELFTGR